GCLPWGMAYSVDDICLGPELYSKEDAHLVGKAYFLRRMSVWGAGLILCGRCLPKGRIFKERCLPGCKAYFLKRIPTWGQGLFSKGGCLPGGRALFSDEMPTWGARLIQRRRLGGVSPRPLVSYVFHQGLHSCTPPASSKLIYCSASARRL
ncbi:UNVERIFIED_CONTAM: hypothetical protein Sangu_2843900, partial [Sesamum angustifolium]